ncbi:MAG: multicopper oxidase domain-containing protein [Actinobacteria bacterium]|nr:multicopper oxidase domain-containing protein [Actinomycetota bacterium]
MTARNHTRPAAHRRARRWGAVALAIAGLTSATALTTNHTVSAVPPTAKSEGLLCTPPTGATPGQANYVLTAKEGIINLPDGNSMLMWGYANGNGAFQYPGPVMCVNEGDVVTVTLRNQLAVRTSALFLGIDGVTANGAPAQAQFDQTATTATLRSLTDDVAPGGSITYKFTAGHPGTYLYESGTDPELQIEMGLVGSLIVYPTTPADTSDLLGESVGHARLAYDDPNSRYSTEHEYMVLLTELDPDVHYAVEEGGVLQSADYTEAYTPRYFLINGRSFPDTIAPNGAGWLPAQPYGALAHVEPLQISATPTESDNPLPALIRYLAVGGEPYPFHPHSNHEKVIAKDGRLLSDGGVDLSMEKFAITVDPGSTIDALFTWTNVEDYSATANPTPVPGPDQKNLTEGEYWSGSPYLGGQGVLNPEVQAKNVCGEYYHVAHNHNLAEATNYGAAFGGQLTLIRVDPANTTNCGNA